jgi:hypothetical protein
LRRGWHLGVPGRPAAGGRIAESDSRVEASFDERL